MTVKKPAEARGTVMSLVARVRERWILVAALITALFWLRDQIVIYTALPGDLRGQGAQIEELTDRVGYLEARLAGPVLRVTACEREAAAPEACHPPSGASGGR